MLVTRQLTGAIDFHSVFFPTMEVNSSIHTYSLYW